MLKVLTSSCLQNRFHAVTTSFTPQVRRGTESNTPLLQVLGSLRSSNSIGPYLYRRFFCSDSTDGSEPNSEAKQVEGEIEVGDADSKASAAIVPTVFRPEDCLTDPKVLAALVESRKRQAPYAGAFLIKDEQGTDPNVVSASDTEKNIYELKGKDLFSRLHEVGTLAQITSIQGDQVILIGHRRIRMTEVVSEEPLTVKVDHLKEKPYNKDDDVIKATSFEVLSTLRDVLKTSSLWKDHVQTYIQSNFLKLQHIGDFNYARLADFGAAISGANQLQCQQVLEELDVHKRLQLTLEIVKKEMEISKIQESIAKAIEEKISGEQRRYLLNEQLKAIKKACLETDDKTALSAKFRERLEPNKEKIPAHVMQVIEEELTKLQLLEASSSEFNVTRNYLDWLTALPWGSYSDENFDVLRAETILDEDHYGLSDVKERILEFIAVGKLRGTSQGKIICLSGPPGVGKTSIGRSIARALNRKFYRFSVGGLSDVAEIKGHRRTYIGAMPGKMVQCLKSVGTANPLVLIDEIDKLGRGHAGDPASAMLELLDPEQNANFLDHYLDVPIDLSKVSSFGYFGQVGSALRGGQDEEDKPEIVRVLFVCTANVLEMIPNPLLDRMEVIAIAGYITDEKLHIARDYLEKSTRETCGIKPEQVEVTDAALLALIENYCREAGVRNLQKQIEKIYRKIALKLVRKDGKIEPQNAGVNEVKAESVHISDEIKSKEETQAGAKSAEGTNDDKPSENVTESLEAPVNQMQKPIDEDTHLQEVEEVTESEVSKTIEKVVVDSPNLADYVGKPIFHAERIYDQTPVGVVMGLAWTSMGGSTLYIETSLVEQGEGKGALNVTGQLGDVMKESAQIAHTVSRIILQEKEPDNHFFSNSKLHLHVPAGSTPKDGPSAGCTMITSLLSLAMKKPVKPYLAMTGEVTLTGKILPIGGVKEKTIAARRSDVKTIIFPSANRRDFDELTPNVKEGLDAKIQKKGRDREHKRNFSSDFALDNNLFTIFLKLLFNFIWLMCRMLGIQILWILKIHTFVNFLCNRDDKFVVSSSNFFSSFLVGVGEKRQKDDGNVEEKDDGDVEERTISKDNENNYQCRRRRPKKQKIEKKIKFEKHERNIKMRFYLYMFCLFLCHALNKIKATNNCVYLIMKDFLVGDDISYKFIMSFNFSMGIPILTIVPSKQINLYRYTFKTLEYTFEKPLLLSIMEGCDKESNNGLGNNVDNFHKQVDVVERVVTILKTDMRDLKGEALIHDSEMAMLAEVMNALKNIIGKIVALM
ncbi:hypothetical protein H5410_051522 [Solanum commersonii]|uniref:Lon protease homolog, mitochondrial n=1 Tax=Solanum commersonii TaxID=4109 RepID=A0A9J5WZR9_SOLCO|nr:hypothetical protein H5410_051522 [Solanum commersonii]